MRRQEHRGRENDGPLRGPETPWAGKQAAKSIVAITTVCWKRRIRLDASGRLPAVGGSCVSHVTIPVYSWLPKHPDGQQLEPTPGGRRGSFHFCRLVCS